MDTSWIVVSFIVVWAVLVLIASIVTVESGSIGLVFRFGKLRRVLDPGLNFIIPLIDKVEHHSAQIHQDELPTDSENIDRVSDVPPQGKKSPFRIKHRGKEEATFYVKKRGWYPSGYLEDPLDAYDLVLFHDLEDSKKEAMKNDPTHVPLTSEMAVVVEWYLKAADYQSIEDYVQNVSSEQGRNRTEEVRKRMSDMVSRVLQELLGPTTLGHATEMLPLSSEIIRWRLEILVGERADPKTGRKSDKPWGIYIRDAYLKAPYPGHTVNKAMADAAASVSKKQEAIRTAEGQAEAIRVKAEADAFAEHKKGEGEAARITTMAMAMRDPNAQFIAGLDVAENVLPKANFIVVPADDKSALWAAIGAIAGKK